MAIAFIRVKAGSRRKGQSAVASSAYRSCEKMYDERSDKIQDYSKKKGHIAGGLVLPPGVEKTKEDLWTNVESFERRWDARLFKDATVALPKELSEEEIIRLSQEIAKNLAIEKADNGEMKFYCVQWDIHGPHVEAEIDDSGNFVFDEKGNKKLVSNDNVHCHFMITERSWDFLEGTFSKEKKDRYRNTDEWLAQKKLEIGELINSMLRQKGIPEIDFRSWEVRNQESIKNTGKGLDKPQKHNGPAKTNKKRKRRRRLARRKLQINGEIKDLEKALSKMDKTSKSNSNKTSKGRYASKQESWTEEISKEVERKIAEQKKEAAFVQETEQRNAGNEGRQINGGPSVKCTVCIPDDSMLCKACKFRKKKNRIIDNEISI